MRALRSAWLALLLLTKPDGGRIWIVDSQIVAVLELHGVGASDTAVVTLGGAYFVREPAAAIAAKLGWRP